MDDQYLLALVDQACRGVANALSSDSEEDVAYQPPAKKAKTVDDWKERALRGELSSSLDSGIKSSDLYFGHTASNMAILKEERIKDRGPKVDKMVDAAGKDEGKLPPAHTKSARKETAGEEWYGLEAPEITPQLHRELQVLKLRGYIDPKRHYKKDKDTGLPKYFQMGRVVAGPTEFYSSRLANRERHTSMVDELLADQQTKHYAKTRFLAYQQKQASGGRKHYQKMQSKKVSSGKRLQLDMASARRKRK
eukprot:comp6450_c0_seq1/m.2234 comp6450_c0_seq1/g.2234  ORF comp6450_c0_seq1/g.2234 comp6450_c0_seq1/m.2234 type:complete len:250 (-) comp6450_c0_seq1:352-1101(-)